jgi:RNA polymerase sigma-70 factor (ECF subfamily)
LDSSDRKLVERARAGDQGGIDALLRRHGRPLWCTLCAALKNRQDAEEVFQETWLRAIQSLACLRDPGRLRAWLVSIGLNLARARQRRAALSAYEPVDEGTAHLASEAGPEVELERKEELLRLRAALATLPPRQREVVDLRLNHGLDHADIARELGISAEASRANFYQALKNLRARLDPSTED